MGDTRQIGLVYGTPFKMSKKISKAAEKAIDIECLIQDNYTLLDYESAGFPWSDDTADLLIVKDMGRTEYDEYLLNVSKKLAVEPSKEALAQMQEFCDKYSVKCKPGWYVFMYVG